LRDSKILPSAGTLSPEFKTIISPGTSSVESIILKLPLKTSASCLTAFLKPLRFERPYFLE